MSQYIPRISQYISVILLWWLVKSPFWPVVKVPIFINPSHLGQGGFLPSFFFGENWNTIHRSAKYVPFF